MVREMKKKCKGIHGTKMFNYLIRNNRNMSKITNITIAVFCNSSFVSFVFIYKN